MILRRVEYIRCCDGPDCNYSEAADWSTRQEAIDAAEHDGWVRCSRGRWLCPGCRAKAQAHHDRETVRRFREIHLPVLRALESPGQPSP